MTGAVVQPSMIRRAVRTACYANTLARASSVGTALNSICSGNGASLLSVCAVGDAGVIMRSASGNNLSSVASGTANNLLAVNFGNSMFCTVGAGPTILTSPDMAVWTSRAVGARVSALAAVTTDGAGKWLAAGAPDAQTFMYSTDNGATWILVNHGTLAGQYISGLAYQEKTGLWVAVTYAAGIWTSPDPAAGVWTQRDAAGGTTWYCVTLAANGDLLAGGENGGFGKVKRSANATVWTDSGTPDDPVYSLAVYQEWWLAAGGLNHVNVSRDAGATWKLWNSGGVLAATSGDYKAVAIVPDSLDGHSYFMAVSTLGYYLSSLDYRGIGQ